MMERTERKLSPEQKLETPLRRRKRRRAMLFVKIGFLILFFLFVSSVFVLNVEAFRVKIIEVTGAKRVSAEEIYARSNISIGENIFTLPISSIRDSIVDREPLVKSASVQRIVPSRIRIQIIERQPFAYVTDGKLFYLIDNERVVLEKPNGIADTKLFRINTDSLKRAEVGEQLVFPKNELFERMCNSLEKALKGKYRQVMFNREGIKLFLNDGTYVLLGDGEDIEKKILLVPVIVQRLRELNEKYVGINLTSLEVPSYIKK